MARRTPVHAGYIPVDKILVHPRNAYRDLGDLRELAGSIKAYGQLQAVVVERHGDGWFRLRHGERRWAAAKINGETKIMAIIHHDQLGDDEWLEQSIHENYFRTPRDPAERRRAIAELRQLGYTWEGVARTFRASVATVKRWASDEPPRPRSSPRISRETLASLASDWRERARTSAVTVEEILDALDTVLQPGQTTLSTNHDQQAA
jgi:ParB-like chromosome segregation protein Spo0J